MWIIKRKRLKDIIIDWLRIDIRNLAYGVFVELRDIEQRQEREYLKWLEESLKNK